MNIAGLVGHVDTVVGHVDKVAITADPAHVGIVSQFTVLGGLDIRSAKTILNIEPILAQLASVAVGAVQTVVWAGNGLGS